MIALGPPPVMRGGNPDVADMSDCRAVVELAPPSQAAGCQFPLGDYPYHSCGEKTTPGASTSVYCKEHYKKCYRQRLDGYKFKVEGNGRIYPRLVVGWGSHMTSVL